MSSRRHYDSLRAIAASIANHRDLPSLFRRIAEALSPVVPFQFLAVILYDEGRQTLSLNVLEPPSPSDSLRDEWPLAESAGGRVVRTQQPIVITDASEVEGRTELCELLRSHSMRAGVLLPLTTPHQRVGVLALASSMPSLYGPAEVEFLLQVANQVAMAIDNAVAYRRISELTERLSNEKIYLENEIRSAWRFESIVGESAALRSVMTQVQTVAPTDSTVLLLGETGTGKELVARAIHDLSPRKARTLVRVNCAAIPSGLLESELFGHEKGAFTGALGRKVGRFELADGGTILLDEVAEIPLELQSKLLRVLQEREFERLGNSRSIKANVRVVAATNRDLAAMVADRQFRGDLFYRLNVFPIEVPPLRQRTEDIPLLVAHFMRRHGQRLNKPMHQIDSRSIGRLMAWHWPGNVRELENVVERAVILSRNGVLNIDAAMPAVSTHPLPPVPSIAAARPGSLVDVERAHVLKVLEETGWVIGGPAGAAARLGMKRTTLSSRLKKLGISRAR